MDYLTVNGTDLTAYVASHGLNWSRASVEGRNGGLMLDGSTTFDRLATKVTLEVTFIAMPEETLRGILELFQDEYLTVTYSDPLSGTRTMIARVQSLPASVFIRRADGETIWDGVSVTIVER